MTFSEIKDAIMCDTLSKRGRVYIARWEFFYTHGHTAKMHAEHVEKELANVGVTIVDYDEIWKNFRGGASTANSSHFRVTFTLNNNPDEK